MQTRDYYIDFLRAIGFLLIVVAHTSPPGFIQPFRCFDVPLMVFVSAMCYKPLRGGYLAYSVKRFKRLYCPVATFLAIFFSINIVLFLLNGYPKFSFSKFVGSFLLLNEPSIGYVWIIRVFLMVALLLPFLYNQIKRISKIYIILIFWGIIILQHYFVNVLYYISSQNIFDRSAIDIIQETIPYIIGYIPFVMLGIIIREKSAKVLYCVFLPAIILLLAFLLDNGSHFHPEAYKYPPRDSFILYGLVMCSLLYFLKHYLNKISQWRIWGYLSKHSMWLYLWHILPIYYLKLYPNEILTIPYMWPLRYLLVLGIALLLCIINNKIDSKLKKQDKIAL